VNVYLHVRTNNQHLHTAYLYNRLFFLKYIFISRSWFKKNQKSSFQITICFQVTPESSQVISTKFFRFTCKTRKNHKAYRSNTDYECDATCTTTGNPKNLLLSFSSKLLNVLTDPFNII